jgi:hypothetical protein
MHLAVIIVSGVVVGPSTDSNLDVSQLGYFISASGGDGKRAISVEIMNREEREREREEGRTVMTSNIRTIVDSYNLKHIAQLTHSLRGMLS